MEIIKEKEWLEQFPIVSQFYNSYKDLKGIKMVCGLAETEEIGNPDKTAFLLLRLFIETTQKIKENQKFILGFRFYNFGDMATLDLISLNFPNHRDIAFEHAKRLGWETLSGSVIDKFRDSYSVPFLFSGGHLKINSLNEISFSGGSGDYGEKILGWNTNKIACALSNFCEISVQGDTMKGQDFFKRILDFMLENKLKNNFYENFVQQNIKNCFTAQHFGSLVTMKTLDRFIKEDKDFFQILIEEISDGLGKFIFLTSVKYNIEKKT